MSASLHTFGPSCRLYEQNKRSATDSQTPDTPPNVKARFFYASALPIDDPLSHLPVISSSQSKLPARPFSSYDNAALEEAWQGISKGEKAVRKDLTRQISGLHLFHPDHGTGTGYRSKSIEKTPSKGTAAPLLGDLPTVMSTSLGSTSSRLNSLRNTPPRSIDDRTAQQLRKTSVASSAEDARSSSSDRVRPPSIAELLAEDAERQITGNPFQRAPPREHRNHSLLQDFSEVQQGSEGIAAEDDSSIEDGTAASASTSSESVQAYVPVGLSRLHLVEMPNLQAGYPRSFFPLLC